MLRRSSQSWNNMSSSCSGRTIGLISCSWLQHPNNRRRLLPAARGSHLLHLLQHWPVTPSSRFFAASPVPCNAAGSSGGSGGIYCIGGGDTASRAWDTFELFSPSAGGGAQVNWTVSGKQMQVRTVPLMAAE